MTTTRAATAAGREATITAKIIAYINRLPSSYAHKVHGGPYGNNGEPDIDACIRGCTVKIEVKRPGKKPTALQQQAITRWTTAGAVAFVAHSLDEVEATLVAHGLVTSDD